MCLRTPRTMKMKTAEVARTAGALFSLRPLRLFTQEPDCAEAGLQVFRCIGKLLTDTPTELVSQIASSDGAE